MMRLQDEGIYPAKFSCIKVPILMLHGTFDPHPGRMILSSLNSYLPQIEYHEWDQCGHYPWLERAVGEEFFSLLRGWLLRTAGFHPAV
jgi:pimeloyl-ACP methyl ester carboxylesterase